MKNIFFIGTFFILFEFTAQGQNLYSMQNLQLSSPENLRTYLTFAQKQKKTGGIILTTGAVSTVTGFAVAAATKDNGFLNTGSIVAGWMILLGAATVMVGIPIYITGSTRVDRINEILNNSNGVSIEIAPCNFQNLITQNTQIGITLRLKF